MLSFVEMDTTDNFLHVCISSGLVPLHNACSYGHYEVTELLLKVKTLTVVLEALTTNECSYIAHMTVEMTS